MPIEPAAAGRPVLVGMNRNQTRYHDVMTITNAHRYDGHLSNDLDTSRTSASNYGAIHVLSLKTPYYKKHIFRF